jgi:hypothetical protein
MKSLRQNLIARKNHETLAKETAPDNSGKCTEKQIGGGGQTSRCGFVGRVLSPRIGGAAGDGEKNETFRRGH